MPVDHSAQARRLGSVIPVRVSGQMSLNRHEKPLMFAYSAIHSFINPMETACRCLNESVSVPTNQGMSE